MNAEKPTHTIVLDAGPIIKGDPSISSLLAQSEQLVTLPSIIQEIRDAATRSRLQTTLLPFLVLKSPKEGSVKVITDFARKTGDLSVLSRVDIHLLALAYDLECERNGGDWRLRKTPGEKRINGPKPGADASEQSVKNSGSNNLISSTTNQTDISASTEEQNPTLDPSEKPDDPLLDSGSDELVADAAIAVKDEVTPSSHHSQVTDDVSKGEGPQTIEVSDSINTLQLSGSSDFDESSGSDSEGWITPSNLKKKQTQDTGGVTDESSEPKVLQVVLVISITCSCATY
jgi:RNA-binding protein NOB1